MQKLCLFLLRLLRSSRRIRVMGRLWLDGCSRCHFSREAAGWWLSNFGQSGSGTCTMQTSLYCRVTANEPPIRQSECKWGGLALRVSDGWRTLSPRSKHISNHLGLNTEHRSPYCQDQRQEDLPPSTNYQFPCLEPIMISQVLPGQFDLRSDTGKLRLTGVLVWTITSIVAFAVWRVS